MRIMIKSYENYVKIVLLLMTLGCVQSQRYHNEDNLGLCMGWGQHGDLGLINEDEDFYENIGSIIEVNCGAT